jgi:hypothetical protein
MSNTSQPQHMDDSHHEAILPPQAPRARESAEILLGYDFFYICQCPINAPPCVVLSITLPSEKAILTLTFISYTFTMLTLSLSNASNETPPPTPPLPQVIKLPPVPTVSPPLCPCSIKQYSEPYATIPLDDNKPTQTPPIPGERPFHAPHTRTWAHRFLYPSGVTPRHRKYEHWLGRIGFGAKVSLFISR